jgi:prevent-host-death family protein
MLSLSAAEARAKLYRLVEDASHSSQPVAIAGNRGHAVLVLVPAAHWHAIQETLALLAVPGMLESIREGLATPVETCARSLDW